MFVGGKRTCQIVQFRYGAKQIYGKRDTQKTHSGP
jgi:hypothetical protein